MTPGLFVTGTDTGVGKTVVAGAIVAALRTRGMHVAAFKPVVTGLDEEADLDWPRDHELLAAAAGAEPGDVTPHTYGPPASPHLAAALAGETLALPALVAAAREAARDAEVLVVEGVGGLLVPLADGADIRDLAAELGLPLIVVARPGLGTINHTLLTLEAARSRGLTVAGVVLNPWPEQPSEIEHSNRETIAARGAVAVHTLRRVAAGRPELLAAAGLELPLSDWLA